MRYSLGQVGRYFHSLRTLIQSVGSLVMWYWMSLRITRMMRRYTKLYFRWLRLHTDCQSYLQVLASRDFSGQSGPERTCTGTSPGTGSISQTPLQTDSKSISNSSGGTWTRSHSARSTCANLLTSQL